MSKDLSRPESGDGGGAENFRVSSAKSELASRLREAVDAAGGADAVAGKSGIARNTLYNYMRGENEPKALALGQIALTLGLSLDWLVFGRATRTETSAPKKESDAAPEAAGPLETSLLQDCLELIEEWLERNDRQMSAPAKAQIVTQIYQFALEDRRLGKEPIDSHRVAQFLRLVA